MRAVGDAGVHLVVVEVAEGGIVLKGHLGHLVLGVDGHLEGVGAEGELGDVDPLAVDVVVVDVLAAGRDALVAVVLAVVFGIHAGAVVVLEAKASSISKISKISILSPSLLPSKLLSTG